jgi:membrane-bound serine protease (ClpP class)
MRMAGVGGCLARVFGTRQSPRAASYLSVACGLPMACGLVCMLAMLVVDGAAADDLFSGDPFAEAGVAEAEPAPQPPPSPAAKPAPERVPEVADAAPAEDHLPVATMPPPVVPLTLRLPIEGNRDTLFQATVLRQLPKLRSQPGQRGLLVVRFDGTAEGPSDFGRSLEVARFLSGRQLEGVKTIAWVPQSVSGHAVLAVLACEEIVMAPTATLGPIEEDPSLVDEAMRVAYAEISARRQSFPPAVSVAMADPAARALRVTTPGGEQFVGSREEVDVLRETVAVLDVDELGPSPLVFAARDAREAGFVQWLAETPEEVARGIGVPAASLAEDPSLGGGWRAVQIPLAGAIDAANVARVRTRVAEAVEDGANLICLRIDSPGGSAEQSLVLATALAAMDPTVVRTVAWVPSEALSDAALVALACDELVMAEEALLGGEGAGTLDGGSLDPLRVAWREGVAKPRDRSWSLPLAVVSPGIAVRRYTNVESGRVAYFSEEELLERADQGVWKAGPQIGVGPIRMTGSTAESFGLTTHLVESAAEFSAAYGLEREMAIVEPSWVDQLFDALAQPGVAWLLLLIGGAGLYIELHTPGLGLGGFVAMVAFIVYFWSQYLQGTAGWLEVMLFLAGLFCLAAEIFVLPGFGVLGLGGGLLIVGSLVLASQSFIVPSNDYQMRQLQSSLFGILAAATGILALAVLARRWLPATPMLRNVLLVPPDDATAVIEHEPLDELIGLEGVTTSRLAPAGTARIEGRVQNVCVEGGLIEPGRQVRVIEVRSGRVIVREVS